MGDQEVDRDLTAARPSGRHARHRILAIVGIGLAILVVAYGLFSGRIVNGVASAAGARPDTSFYALWFANPSVAARPVPRGTALDVAVSNQTRSAQTLHWSAFSAAVPLQLGSIYVPKGSTRTFVVQTEHALLGQWLFVRLDGTPIVIKAIVVS